MNKKFTKLIAALALLVFMMPSLAGWGQSRTVKTYKLTIDASNFNTTSYVANNNEKTSLAVNVSDATDTYEVKWTSYQVMKENVSGSTNMQWQKNAGKIYNSTDLGTITDVTVTSSAGTFTTYYGTSEQPSYGAQGDGKGYFKTSVGGATGYSTKVEVVFEIEGDVPSTYTLTYNRNGANSGNVPVDNTVYDATNNIVTVVGNTGNLAKEHYSFGGWNTKADGTGTNYVAGDTFIIEASTTLYAKWNIITHTATFSVNGTTTTQDFAEGAAITFPADPANIEDKTFVGWVNEPINGTTNEAPEFVTSATMGNSDVTYYAVFATADASGAPVETLTQTLQYDTWTYGGTTSNQNGYRLFGNSGYVESAEFDLSTLSKVIVYGGTYGGTSYNSLTIGDGTNVWKNVTVSGSSQTGTNTYTEGTPLTGNGKLRVISNSGNANGSGVRMSKVEIFTIEPSIIYSGYCTTVEVSMDPSVTVTPSTIDAPYQGSDGTLALTYANISNFISFDYYFCDADGNELEDTDPNYPSWITAAINENTLTYTIGINEGTLRTAYFKVYTLVGDELEEVGAIVAVSQAAAPPKYALTVSNLSHVALYVFAGGNDPIIDEGGEGSAQVYEGLEVQVSVDVESGYVLQSLLVDGVGVTDDIDPEDDSYTFTMPGHAVTISATAVEYVPVGTIVFGNNGTKINGASVTGNDGLGNTWTITTLGTTSFTQNTEYSQVGKSSEPATSITFTTTLPNEAIITSFEAKFGGFSGTAGTITLKVGETTVGTGSLNATDDVVVSNSSVASGTTLTVTITDIAKGVKCYYISYAFREIFTKEIAANTWYFIASPVGSAPTNMEEDLTDLYFYDEQNHYWRNKNVEANANGFGFARGKGYLAGNENNTVILSFVGTPITANSYSVNLDYHTQTSQGQDNSLAGWNLVGNPFPSNATIDRPFFILEGSNLKASTSTTIAPCTGVMVQAAAVDVTQNPYTVDYSPNNIATAVTFTKENSSNPVQPNQLQMTVAQQVVNRDGVSAETVDNAIVSFNEGNYLEKFVFNADLAKLYIPQGGMDFAIVSNEGQGNLPVNFKATEDGTYTITVNPEGVEMNYLHLIDNMTGNDIDLLYTPSYSFNATTNDYESRFRLVFASNGASTGSATDAAFAFMSDGNWIINNAGEATLQVIDLNGRILSSERVNGSVSKTVNATPGVYMLRLINGENVKVQKIVVR